MIRYIHLNPVKAGSICLEKLEDYRWTGHREIVEKGKDGEIISKEEVLLYFGKKETEAKKRYTEFIKEGIGEKTNYEGGGLIRSGGG
ncbi:MAG: hypothetical protein KKH34_05665, partial [Candidatus Omnitrophica bacterium]|nr:hypothetical protein [Candidatus Omnitrophota bacterium]